MSNDLCLHFVDDDTTTNALLHCGVAVSFFSMT